MRDNEVAPLRQKLQEAECLRQALAEVKPYIDYVRQNQWILSLLPHQLLNASHDHAVYAVDQLPEGEPAVAADIPSYAGHEMVAGSGPLVAVVDGRPVPLVDPMPYWSVMLRVDRAVPKQELVNALLAITGAIETGELPEPAAVPTQGMAFPGSWDGDGLSPIERLARRTLRGDRTTET